MTGTTASSALLHRMALSRVQQPLDPSSEQARSWLREELAKAKYHAQPSLFERLQEALMRWLNGLGGGPGLPSWVVPVVVIVVIGVVALILNRVLRREPPGARGDGDRALFEGPATSAKELRASAEAALAAGDADAALLDGYRALVANGIERTLIDDRPGRTAHEAARDLSPVFPADADDLRHGADTFDAIRYGGRHTNTARAQEILELERRLRSTAPVLPDLEVGAPLTNLPGLPAQRRTVVGHGAGSTASGGPR